MAILDLFRRAAPTETRNAENPSVPVSSANFWAQFGLDTFGVSAAGVTVTIDNALGVPAVWAAVNVLSGELASLPLHVYRRTGDGRERVKSQLATLLHDAVNDELTSFQWRKGLFDQVFTGGRSFTFIERNATGRITNLWPIDPATVTVRREGWRKVYTSRENGVNKVYEASEIIDVPFMLKNDGVGHRGPVATNADVIGMAIAATRYASKFFQNGGVPPFAVTGQFVSGGAMTRASDDLTEAIRKAAKEQRQALVLPAGLEIKQIGADPDKSQLIEAHRFLIEQIARIYSLPPSFLQDLSRSTFSNAEQQDLAFVKHTLLRWVDQFEKELNLKIFGRNSNVQFVEMNVDGLLRGDFKTRMDGYATGIQHGIMTPNEARRKENLPDMGEGDSLYMQGAMMKLGGDGGGAQPATDLGSADDGVDNAGP